MSGNASVRSRRPGCNFELGSLVIKVFHQQEYILVERHLVLTVLGQYHLAVRLGHFDFSFPFTPVEQRDAETDFDDLPFLRGL